MCYLIEQAQYENRAKWDCPSRFVNCNPVTIPSGVHQNKYAVPTDFLLPDVVAGSPENEEMRDLLETFPTVDITPFEAQPGEPPPPPTPPPPPPAPQFNGYASGSLGKHLIDSVDVRLAGKEKLIYSTQNHSVPSYIRNTNCWGYGLDLTAISPWNSNGGNLGAGTLITRRHLLSVAHFPIQGDAQVRFITNDNQVVTRTIIQRQGVMGAQYTPDMQLYLLDSDAPITITPVKILPADYANYIDHITEGHPPGMVLDQEEKCLVTDLSTLDQRYQCRKPTDATRLSLYENLIAFDSGNPFFVIINGQLVFIGSTTSGGAGNGTFTTSYIPTINQLIINVDALASISTGYTVQTIDLSGFPTI